MKENVQLPDEIVHTTFAEQQAFLALPMEQQNLRIYMSSKETNGELAAVKRELAEMAPIVRRHDFAFKIAALAFAAIIAAGPFIIAYHP